MTDSKETPTVDEVVRELGSQARFLHQASSEIGCAGHYGWGNTCSQAADAIEDAITMLQSLAKDAARYAWLRDPHKRDVAAQILLDKMDCDTAIDLARGAATTSHNQEHGK